MNTERIAHKVVDLIADGRHSAVDMDALGFHIINLSTRSVRANALIMADAIIHYSYESFGDIDGQDTLF